MLPWRNLLSWIVVTSSALILAVGPTSADAVTIALDPTFGTNGQVAIDLSPSGSPGTSSDTSSRFKILADDRVLIQGSTTINGPLQSMVVLLTSEGVLDPSLAGTGWFVIEVPGTATFFARDAAMQADGKIVVAGRRDDHFAVARFLSDGSLDSSFGTGGVASTTIGFRSFPEEVVVGDSSIFVAGTSWHNPPSLQEDCAVAARFDLDGNLVSSFGNNGVLELAPPDVSFFYHDYGQANDGSMHMLSGFAGGVGQISSVRRFLADGSLVYAHTLSDDDGVNSISGSYLHIDGLGRTTVSGDRFITELRVWRLLSDGTRDPAFGGPGQVAETATEARLRGMAVGPNGAIALLGQRNGLYDMTAFDPNGVQNVGAGDNGWVNVASGSFDPAVGSALATQSTGKLLLVGSETNGSTSDLSITRFLPLQPPVSAAVVALDAQAAERGVQLSWSISNGPMPESITVHRQIAGQPGPVVLHHGQATGPEGSFLDRSAEAGVTYDYTVVMLVDGRYLESETARASWSVEVASRAQLLGNVPNPFNPRTSVRFRVGQQGPVRLAILDAMGRRIVDTDLGLLDQGLHQWEWDGRNTLGNQVSSGVYLVELTTGHESDARLITLVR